MIFLAASLDRITSEGFGQLTTNSLKNGALKRIR